MVEVAYKSVIDVLNEVFDNAKTAGLYVATITLSHAYMDELRYLFEIQRDPNFIIGPCGSPIRLIREGTA